MTPAEQIKAIRAQTGLSQQAFAAAYEIPRRSIEDWETGKRVPPVYLAKMMDLYVKTFPPDKLEGPE